MTGTARRCGVLAASEFRPNAVAAKGEHMTSAILILSGFLAIIFAVFVFTGFDWRDTLVTVACGLGIIAAPVGIVLIVLGLVSL
ncbi:putative membrane protein [Mycolicibacterium sp. BK634]|uniref:hypothetical protein n=1 Tax=Mycolicibacterium sp. BK634 TaxID=2587099 RepID=UPI001619C066|nr:hypothetical protein [Mycolicibacterium sp. BK634]MBB3752676.1 putative membrane protein [Mycolicibacterium sp. BK634]